MLQCLKKAFGHLYIFPLNPIVNTSFNIQCCGNKMHRIVIDMMLSHYLRLRLSLRMKDKCIRLGSFVLDMDQDFKKVFEHLVLPLYFNGSKCPKTFVKS